MCPSVIRSPNLYVRTGNFSPLSPQEDKREAAATAASKNKKRSWRMLANPLSSRATHLSSRAEIGPWAGINPLPGLAFLKDALEFPALLLVENLFDLGFAFAQHGAVIGPEIIQDGLHLLLLGGREVQFALHPREIDFPARGGIEGRLVQAVMHAEIHDDRSRRGATQKYQRQRDHAGDLGIPRSGETRFLDETSAHRSSSWPACFPAPGRYRRRANPAAPSRFRGRGRWGKRSRRPPDSCPAPLASPAT